MEIKDYFILSISILALIFSFINTKIQIKANRKQMKENNLMNLRKEWIQDFIKLSSEIYEFVYIRFATYNESKPEFINRIHKIYYFINELRLRTTIDGEELKPIINELNAYVVSMNEYYENKLSLTDIDGNKENREVFLAEYTMSCQNLEYSIDSIQEEFIKVRKNESAKLIL